MGHSDNNIEPSSVA